MAKPYTHPHRLEDIPELITLSDLADRRRTGHSYRQLAEQLGVSYEAIRTYCHTHLEPDLCRRTNWRLRNQPHCKRCHFLPEPTNPLLPDNLCLYCHIEAAGLTLLGCHETGL